MKRLWKWFVRLLLIGLVGLLLILGIYVVHRALETPAERAAEDQITAERLAAEDRAEADARAAQAKADEAREALEKEAKRHDQVSLTTLAETLVSPKLRDPQSAQYSNLELDRTGNYLCGYVNAKNGFGGYTGATAFVATEEMVILDDGSRAFRKWAHICD